MKTAVGYICIKSNSVAEEYQSEIELQKTMINDFGKSSGYRISEWYIDVLGVGHSNSRSNLDMLLYEDILKSTVKAVIVAKPDSLTDDKLFFYYFDWLLEKKGVKLINASEDSKEMGISTADKYKALIQFTSEQEIKRQVWNVNRSREAKSAKGGYSGGRPPFGYKVSNHSLVLVESEAEIIRKIFYMRDIEKETYHGIAEKLTEQGYKNIKDGAWSAASIVTICENRKRYQGYCKFGKDGTWVKGEHTPIIGEN